MYHQCTTTSAYLLKHKYVYEEWLSGQEIDLWRKGVAVSRAFLLQSVTDVCDKGGISCRATAGLVHGSCKTH